MGNSFTKIIDRWSLNPQKRTNRVRRKKDSPEDPAHGSPGAPMYDTVAEIPQYSVPNKMMEPPEDLHYAEVQVLQRRSSASRGSQTTPNTSTGTVYATIDFRAQTAAPSRGKRAKSATIQKPADILISPGELQKPIPKPRLMKSPSQKPE